jgi:hypothetical protein
MTQPLLSALGRRVNHRGLVIASEDALIEELHVTHDALVDGLRKLEEAKLVETLAPLPFIVLRLRSWSGSSTPRARRAQQISGNPAIVHIEVPVSSRAAAATQQEDGGAGEGEALLDQVLATLGPEADREEFRRILAGHDSALIHRCLRRVRATRSIRVSRAALFRSLLQKLEA